MFGPLIHAIQCLQAESVIYDHCTGTVKKKNRSMLTAVISRAIFKCPGRALPVFRLDLHQRDGQRAVAVSGKNWHSTQPVATKPINLFYVKVHVKLPQIFTILRVHQVLWLLEIWRYCVE